MTLATELKSVPQSPSCAVCAHFSVVDKVCNTCEIHQEWYGDVGFWSICTDYVEE